MEIYSHYELHDIRNLLPEYGIEPVRLLKAIEVIETHFSVEWLTEFAMKPKRSGSPLTQHPIVLGLLKKVVNETTLMMIELATYLEGTSSFANFGDIILELKNPDQFYNAFYTVAIAYRLGLWGVNGKFNPSLGNKTPDIAVEINGKVIYVETTEVNFPSYFNSLENLTHNLIGYFEKTQSRHHLHSHLEIEYKVNAQNEQAIRNAIASVTTQPTQVAEIETDQFKVRIIPVNKIPDEDSVKRHGEEGGFSLYGIYSTTPGNKDDISTWDFNKVTHHNAFFIKFSGALERDVEELILKRVREKHGNYKGVVGDQELYVFVNLPHQRSYEVEGLNASYLTRKFTEKYLDANKGVLSGIVVTQRRPTDLKRWQIHYMSFPNTYMQKLLISRLAFEMAKLDGRCNFYYPIFTHLPERNDVCQCGSGRKFKKCCGWYKDKLNTL